MMKKIILFVLFSIPVFCYAQNTLHFMDRLPQSARYNPAIIPNLVRYTGIVEFSSDLYNSGYNNQNFKDFKEGVSKPGFDPYNFLNRLDKINTYNSYSSLSLFPSGRHTKYGFTSSRFSINENDEAVTSRDILFYKTAAGKIDQSYYPYSSTIKTLTHEIYLQYSKSFSFIVNPNFKLGFGLNISYLFNYDNLSNMVYSAEFATPEKSYDEIDEHYNGNSQLGGSFNNLAIDGIENQFDASLGPNGLDSISTSSKFPDNLSLSFDLGAVFEKSGWLVSASFLNVGNSTWQTNGYSLKLANDSISIVNIQKLKKLAPMKYYIAVRKSVSPKVNVGIVHNGLLFNEKSAYATTFSANQYWGKFISTAISYTAGDHINDIGFGLRLRFLPGFDFYFASDNIINTIYINKTNRLLARFGINITRLD